MLDFLPKKKTTPKVEPPKITTTSQVGGPLGQRTIKKPGAGLPRQAPKPAWLDPSGSGQGFPKPPIVPRDAGAFARQRLLTKPPAAVPSLFGRLKGVRGGPLTTAVNLATGAALDKYVVEPVGKAGGDALARGILDVTGQGNRARQIQPSLYGKAGPDLTKDIVQGIRSREPRGMSNIPPAEGMVNNPNYGKPGTAPKPLSAAAKDFDKTFAAKRDELKRAGKDPNSGTFTWRGKSYNTRIK
jgi:hypothetical protein